MLEKLSDALPFVKPKKFPDICLACCWKVVLTDNKINYIENMSAEPKQQSHRIFSIIRRKLTIPHDHDGSAQDLVIFSLPQEQF